MTDEKSEKAAAAKANEKAAAAKGPGDEGDDNGGKAKALRKPKRPTGKFVATMNLDVLNPRAKKDAEGKWVAGRHTVREGEVVPEFVSEAELAKFQERGVIDHEYA